MSDVNADRIAACIRAAQWARSFAHMHRSGVVLARYREQAEREARQCFGRAYVYLQMAKKIKRGPKWAEKY